MGAVGESLGMLIGHQPARMSVKYHNLPGGARKVITRKTGSSNWFVNPKKSTHEIHLDPKGGRPARKRDTVTQYRHLKTGTKVALGAAGAAAIPAATLGAAVAADNHKDRLRAEQRAKVKKSMTVSAFGIDHGWR